MVIKIALYLELFRYVQFVVKQDKSFLCSSSSQLHISSRGSSQHSPTLACLRARPKPPCCAGYKFIFFCHSLQRWERQSWKYQARDSHEKQINGPEGPPEGTVSRKPKIFSSFTQRDEEADRNIPSIYPLFVDQDQRLTLLTTQVKTYTWLLLCFRHNTMGGGGGVPPYKRLMGMCRWMGSHFHDWIDHNAVAFSIELLEWGCTFSDFLG